MQYAPTNDRVRFLGEFIHPRSDTLTKYILADLRVCPDSTGETVFGAHAGSPLLKQFDRLFGSTLFSGALIALRRRIYRLRSHEAHLTIALELRPLLHH